MKNPELNQNNKGVFPENTSDIIESLLIKYGLETMKELFEKFGPIKTSEEEEEFQERFEKLPGAQIARIVKEVAQGKIRDENVFINTLQESLSISEKTAEELAKDLNEKVLSLVQKTIKEEVILPEEPASPEKKDTYREPIE